MGTLARAADCLVQLTQVGLGAVQAGAQVVATLWGQGQARLKLTGHLPLYLEQLQAEMEQLQKELEREYRRAHNPAPQPQPQGPQVFRLVLTPLPPSEKQSNFFRPPYLISQAPATSAPFWHAFSILEGSKVMPA